MKDDKDQARLSGAFDQHGKAVLLVDQGKGSGAGGGNLVTTWGPDGELTSQEYSMTTEDEKNYAAQQKLLARLNSSTTARESSEPKSTPVASTARGCVMGTIAYLIRL